ncbi:nucleotide-sugar transporter [Artemisia annua]|uniref:Nucleotide-sugar transporter n=1 Tax=Artemisia annua TaxID=35608 RepID=A0A2U1MND7_ARTAN|nr:nucleotide-sugar transporter [Artemisia annua]
MPSSKKESSAAAAGVNKKLSVHIADVFNLRLFQNQKLEGLHVEFNSLHLSSSLFSSHGSVTSVSIVRVREVIVTSSVLACEIVKVTCALFLMAKEGSLNKALREWTLIGSLTASGLPAAIYALQNSLLQISYRNLDSLTFSMQKQSIQQIGALCILILAAVLLSIGEGSRKDYGSGNADEVILYGIIPVLIASVLSGLASALCQWASQVKKHSSYLMTVEMSIVGSLCLLASTYKSPDGEAMRQHGFFHGWTPFTMIPVFINAVGGILVGIVTSYAGGVRKASLNCPHICIYK